MNFCSRFGVTGPRYGITAKTRKNQNSKFLSFLNSPLACLPLISTLLDSLVLFFSQIVNKMLSTAALIPCMPMKTFEYSNEVQRWQKEQKYTFISFYFIMLCFLQMQISAFLRKINPQQILNKSSTIVLCVPSGAQLTETVQKHTFISLYLIMYPVLNKAFTSILLLISVCKTMIAKLF